MSKLGTLEFTGRPRPLLPAWVRLTMQYRLLVSNSIQLLVIRYTHIYTVYTLQQGNIGGSESNNRPPVRIVDCILSFYCKCMSIVIYSRAVHGCPNAHLQGNQVACIFYTTQGALQIIVLWQSVFAVTLYRVTSAHAGHWLRTLRMPASSAAVCSLEDKTSMNWWAPVRGPTDGLTAGPGARCQATTGEEK